MAELSPTLQTTVTPDQIDHLGHMNVQFYGVHARAASQVVATRLGATDAIAVEPVDVYTRHLREQLEGASLEMSSGIISAEPGSVRLYHELRNRDTDDLAATFVHRLIAREGEGHAARWPTSMPEVHPIPMHGLPRTIALDTDPVSSAPLLATVVDRGLATRRPRTITAQECDATGAVPLAHGPMLVWGGEPIERHDGPILHDGPDGVVVGMASMESRLAVNRLPASGDRIQAFGAVLEVRDKVSHQQMWTFDLDRGDLLCSFEVVSVAFDTIGRRAVSFPDRIRAGLLSRLHTDLRAR